MTEIEVVKISLDMWEWLHDNPMKSKREYPDYQVHGIDEMSIECPCCEYYADYKKCRDCPLGIGGGCSDGNFANWLDSNENDDIVMSQTSSKNICRMLRERYKELLNRKSV